MSERQGPMYSIYSGCDHVVIFSERSCVRCTADKENLRLRSFILAIHNGLEDTLVVGTQGVAGAKMLAKGVRVLTKSALDGDPFENELFERD